MVNQENSQTLDLFKSGEVDGAWLPEPWASRLVVEAGAQGAGRREDPVAGREVPDHDPDRRPRPFLEAHPDTVEGADHRRGHRDSRRSQGDPTKAQTELNEAIGELTGKKPLADAMIQAAFANIEPTWDPLAGTLNDHRRARRRRRALLDEAPDLNGIYDLRI